MSFDERESTKDTHSCHFPFSIRFTIFKLTTHVRFRVSLPRFDGKNCAGGGASDPADSKVTIAVVAGGPGEFEKNELK